MTSPPADHAALLQRALDAIDELEARLEAGERQRREPVAVVGMGVRMPGGVDGPDELWDLLVSGRDAVSEVPADRWDLAAFYDPSPGAPGRTYTRWGAYLDGIDRFDAAFFGISPREAASMDPQQRLLLEVAWHTFEHAGVAPAEVAGSRTGVFLGMTTHEYADLAVQGGVMDEVDAYFASGVAQSVAAGRLAYAYDLHGPALALDTACSSSLLSVHLAVRSLRSGECDAALAGGVQLMLSPDGHILTSQARMMSPAGRCKTFDADADGYVRGEGCALVLLKRLSDAEADGDRILAVIRGSAANQDGRSNGLTAPSASAQESVIRAALADAGVEPGAVGFVECHGTGTTLGDPIEVRALQAVFGPGRDRPLPVQSVKTNLGHLEAAAGIAGFCKLVLAVRAGALPTHLHLTRPNPHIPWRDIVVDPVTGPAEWAEPDGACRVGGTSSFGFSGTNVHIVVEQAPVAAAEAAPARSHSAYPVSARSVPALEALALEHADLLDGLGSGDLAAAARAAATCRDHAVERLAVVSATPAGAADALRRAVAGATGPDIVRARAGDVEASSTMLFTGQGSQVPGMGRVLHQEEPVFRASLEESAAIVREQSGLDLLGVMLAGADGSGGSSIHDTHHAQLALVAFELAVVDLWASWGVVPDAVIGHSVGELAAAHVAGVMSRADLLRVVEARGRLMQAMPQDGGMVALTTDAATALEALAPWSSDLALAAVNGPTRVVVSGRRRALDELLVALGPEVAARPLQVSHAFHSPSMDAMLDEFESVVASVDLREPTVELLANRTGAPARPGELTSATYWRDHVRETVRFGDAVARALADGSRVFLEVGPGRTLSALARTGAVPADALFVASCRAGADEAQDLQRAVAALHCRGVDVDWAALGGGSARRPDGLPRYPFERRRHWLAQVDAGRSHGARTAPTPPELPLHGTPVRSPRLHEPAFTREVTSTSPEWLAEHVIHGRTTVPASALLELIHGAGRAVLGAAVDLVDVRIEEALVLDERPVTVQTLVSADGRTAEVHSALGDSWRRHAVATLADATLAPTTASGAAARAAVAEAVEAWERGGQEVDGDDYYAALDRGGVGYGPAFRSIEVARRRDGEAVARLRVPPPPGGEAAAPVVHPGLADACLQVIGLAMPDAADLEHAEQVYVPVAVGRWSMGSRPVGAVTAHARLAGGVGGPPAEVVVGEVTLVDSTGAVVLRADEVRFRRIGREALSTSRPDGGRSYAVRWEPTAAPTAGPGRPAGPGPRWLVAGPVGPDRDGLAAALVTAGAITEAVLPAEVVARLDPSVTGVVHLLDPAGAVPVDAAGIAAVAAAAAGAGLDLAVAAVTTAAAAVVPGDRVEGHEQAAVSGLARAARAEQPDRRWCVVDLADRSPSSLADAATELMAGDPAEVHVAWRAGVRYVPRLVRLPAGEELPPPTGPYELEIVERGRLDALRLVEQGPLTPGTGEVLVDVAATGLNFRDVLNALGTYAGDATSLGNECAGTVVAVGTGVTRVAVGDSVMAVAVGSFASQALAPQELVTRQPPGWTDAEAATVPIAFLTADWALLHLGRLRAGERVLVHAAAGGVGLAAVMIAQRAGAEIFATAGSDHKRAVLRDLGVQHVYDSRSTAFGEQILADSGGAGVDVVLNSLAGDTIAASVAALTPEGRFVEIGLAGIWDAERFHEVRPRAEYHPLFLGEACARHPDAMAARFDAIAAACGSGELRPLPLVAFDVRHSAAAFRYMAQARQVGKVVVTAARGWSSGGTEGTWILSGGLGGLGLELAAELAAAGAERLVLCSRGAPAADAAAAVAALAERGVDVRVVAVDVADADAVAALVGEVTADGLPLVGVVHAAAVLDDALLAGLDADRFDAVWRPKVLGAQTLLAAVDPHRPRHVVLCSAGAALLGSPGQGNYAAANAALDALALARRAAGLPAQAIAWGPWTTVGMAARLGEPTLQRWEAQGILGLSPDDGRRAFRDVVAGGDPQVAVLALRWASLLHHVSKHLVPPLLEGLVREEQRRALTGGARPTAGDEPDLVAALEALEVDQRPAALAAEVRSQVLRVLGLDDGYPLDPDQGFADVGMDSLMAVELGNRLAVLVDRTLPATLAFEQPTVTLMADHLQGVLADRLEFGPGTGGGADRPTVPGVAEATAGRLAAMSELSDDEVAERLLRELEESGY